MQGMRISFRLPWGMPEKPVPPYAEWRAGTKIIYVRDTRNSSSTVAPYNGFYEKRVIESTSTRKRDGLG